MNGSQSQLVLDCKYDFTDEYEKNGLVVKWYFKRKPFPVYQWIPPNKPQVLGILKGRLNLDYEVSADEFSKHRALAIVNPTTELSGEYTCWISTFDSEHVERKMLTIYAPPSEMTLTYYKPRMDTVAVTCRAGGVYPAPDIVIFRSSPSVRKNVIEGAKMERRVVPGRGFYNISIELEAFDYDLDAENMFECVLTIPGTEFKMQKEILYFPGVPALTSSVTSGAGRQVVGSLSVVFILPVLFHYLRHH
ncbi:uncharacterized protein LOC135113750 [Scylla paramamosain]|uniref:uncharacterized protein LOC135113750 n=1 Tax=Scylla paramamosain TaxID=85552 RepID=UPI003082FBD6